MVAYSLNVSSARRGRPARRPARSALQATRSAHVAVLLTGAGIDLLAALFLDDSRAQKYNAVQRYNEVVRGEDSSLPATPGDDKSLLPSAK